jgi:hypothetical protein
VKTKADLFSMLRMSAPRIVLRLFVVAGGLLFTLPMGLAADTEQSVRDLREMLRSAGATGPPLLGWIGLDVEASEARGDHPAIVVKRDGPRVAVPSDEAVARELGRIARTAVLFAVARPTLGERPTDYLASALRWLIDNKVTAVFVRGELLTRPDDMGAEDWQALAATWDAGILLITDGPRSSRTPAGMLRVEMRPGAPCAPPPRRPDTHAKLPLCPQLNIVRSWIEEMGPATAAGMYGLLVSARAQEAPGQGPDAVLAKARSLLGARDLVPSRAGDGGSLDLRGSRPARTIDFGELELPWDARVADIPKPINRRRSFGIASKAEDQIIALIHGWARVADLAALELLLGGTFLQLQPADESYAVYRLETDATERAFALAAFSRFAGQGAGSVFAIVSADAVLKPR